MACFEMARDGSGTEREGACGGWAGAGASLLFWSLLGVFTDGSVFVGAGSFGGWGEEGLAPHLGEV